MALDELVYASREVHILALLALPAADAQRGQLADRAGVRRTGLGTEGFGSVGLLDADIYLSRGFTRYGDALVLPLRHPAPVAEIFESGSWLYLFS